MKIQKQSNFVGSEDPKVLQQYIRGVDGDLRNIFLALNGRLRFGSSTNAYAGENISGEFRVFTSSATANNEDTVAHTLGSVPQGYLVMDRDKAAVLYHTGTAWDTTNIYLNSDTASTTFKIFLIK